MAVKVFLELSNQSLVSLRVSLHIMMYLVIIIFISYDYIPLLATCEAVLFRKVGSVLVIDPWESESFSVAL